MAFPANEKDLEVSVAYGANLASSLPGLTYSANLAPTLVRPRLTITRGRIAGATRTQPTSIGFELKNPAGIFSPRNISGPNYGRLRRNTPVRVRLDAGSGLVTRGIAYMPDWPTRWTGPDIDDRIPMQASGALRRLGTGQQTRSALRRTVLAASPKAYWPLEDASGATSAASALGGSPLTVASGTVGFGGVSSLVGASTAPNMSAGYMRGQVSGVSSTFWHVEFAVKPGTGTAAIAQILTGSQLVNTWRFFVPIADGGDVQLFIDDANGVGPLIGHAFTTSTGWTTAWHHIGVSAEQSGGNLISKLYVDGQLRFTSTTAATLGAPTTMLLNQNVATGVTGAAASFGHVAFGDGAIVSGFYNAVGAYAGELAATRVARLCAEEAVTVDVTAGVSEPMGAQLPGTIVDLLRECEDTDEGTLIERRTGELGFDPRSSRHNKSVVMTVDYVRQVADLLPDDDDRDLVNYATVTRIGGSSATYERTDGPLGTDKATGVDRYPGGPFNRSLATDSQAIQHASYIVYRGTVDEPRYVIVINLVADPELIPQWLACDIGSRILVNNPPVIQVGPAPLDVVIEGYTELLDGVEWLVTIYATPYRINEVLQIETGTGNRSRIPAGVSTLDSAFTAAATSLIVDVPGVKWIDSNGYAAQFPFVVEVAGEAMTCTGINNYLNSNPYFETNALGWTGKGGSLVRSTAQFHEGAASGLLTPTGVAATSEIESETVPVTTGITLVFSAWVRCAVARNINLNINWFSTAAYLSTSSATPVAVLANTWTLLSFTPPTIPATAATATGLVSMTGTPPATNTLHVDEAMLVDPLRQVFTVQRGLHGVSKALPAGSAVQLWRAPAIAL